MFRAVTFLVLVFSSASVYAQDWVEDFGTDATCGIQEADNHVTNNGVWTVESTGTNGPTAHNWFIGPREAGMPIGECGNSCLSDSGLENNTLYISEESWNASSGAVFQNFASSETHLRVVSPAVNLSTATGSMGVKLSYIYSGHDNSSCVLEYFDGATWNDLWTVEETVGTCGGAGQWTNMTIPLPSSLNGNSNVRFGIRWENTGPEEMPAPELSFALDKIECSCVVLLEENVDFSNPLDPNQSPNPVIEWDYTECYTTYEEIYYLDDWLADLYDLPDGTVTLGCTAPAWGSCNPTGVSLSAEIPGCSGDFTVNLLPQEDWVYGPEIWASTSFDLSDLEACEGECLDFTFELGWQFDSEIPEYTIEAPGATLQNLEMDTSGEVVVTGQICFDSPGTYVMSGSFEYCEFTQPEVLSEEIVVSSANISPEITVSDTDICSDGCVEFSIDEVPGADIQWSFQGGSPSVSTEAQTGLICYDTPGTYTVNVSVDGAGGCGAADVAGGITVIDCGEAPVAAFSADITTVCIGECVEFTDESTGTNNSTWSWEFEGATNTTSDEQNPTACYDTPGLYNVTLTVGNLAGTDELVSNNFIEVIDCSDPPVADFSVSTTDLCVGDCISFTDESAGTGNSWLWTFEGAVTTTSTDQHPQDICYETPGSYSVTLVVTNPDGTDELTETAFVEVDPCLPAPQPAFSASATTICPGECVDFTNSSITSGDETWNWSFNGASTTTSSDEEPLGICYMAPGNFSVTLTVTDGGGTESLTQTNLITVEDCPEPNAFFTVSDTLICLGECVQINNQSTGIITGYTWVFPEGVVGDTTAVNPELCFNEPGTYSISLTAFNDDGETSEFILEQAVVVDPCLPEISIAVSEDRICVGDCVSFANVSEKPSTNWQWTFPGAVNSTSQNENPAEVCYHTPGVFDVTLQADFGILTIDSTFSQVIHVIDSCGPVANFNYTPILCYGQCYDFESTSTGGSNYFWTFEGATNPFSEEENPTDICYLNSTGIFNVTLTVTNEFGSSTSITQQVSVVPPTSLNAGPDQTITQGMTAVLSATGGNGSGEFIWQPFEMVNCFSCASTYTTPLQETTTFVVTYEQSGGCIVSDDVTIFVEESFNFGVPNSFSPNGDGVNDLLYVRGSNITKINFMVYNRYGQEVFSTTSQKEGWDGTHEGRELNAGVFGYVLEVEQIDGNRKLVKGDINLTR